ncbi:pescadillo-like protein [Plasmodium reichenowi]|uniref:Pescadillo homolog n=1 Tax=Plasmodium reichenowi TaxID=5854 RepID=A0A060RTU8_PLARE|nr:pescadillo-like protein [Plasmodium reichenowi]
MHIHKLKKKIKKKKEGKYLTKKHILKKLFLNEEEFRKLCIFKGIYPKDFKEIPLKYRKKFYKHKVFYTRNDFLKLSHEKIINDFRKIKIYLKKYKKCKLTLEDFTRSKNIIANFPVYKLEHIIKERYPILSYAVDHLDDALSCIIAYSQLPSNHKYGIKNNMVKTCEMLKDHFHYYVYKTNKIKKAFISVKGYYLQAEILKKKVTWIIPHIFTPYIDTSIDFKLISDFIEYYIALLKFVLFKLYKLDNMLYPPKQDNDLKNEKLAHLSYDKDYSTNENNIDIELKEELESKCNVNTNEDLTTCQEKTEEKNHKYDNNPHGHTTNIDNNNFSNIHLQDNSGLNKNEEKKNLTNNNIIHKNNEADNGRHVHRDDHIDIDEHNKLKELFKNHIFYIHNDMPFDVLSIIILSCGGKISWNSKISPIHYDDNNITHEIYEKDKNNTIHLNNLENEYKRIHIQPQYIFDCLNEKNILPCSDYLTDVENLPVHLSPFIEDENFKNLVKKEEYTINKILNQKIKEEQYKDLSKENNNIFKTPNYKEEDDDDRETANLILNNKRQAALNNQLERENEHFDQLKQNDTILNKQTEQTQNLKIQEQEIQRHKIVLSKKKRKLFARIDMAQKRQKATIDKFMKKINKNKSK